MMFSLESGSESKTETVFSTSFLFTLSFSVMTIDYLSDALFPLAKGLLLMELEQTF
jgi:hypothetical protein